MRDWDKVRIFYTVAQHGSFTKAAHHLNISQSSLSRSVLLLEDELQVTLFHRLARGVSLTAEGMILYEAAEKAFTHLHTADILMHESDTPQRPLKIATAAGAWLVPYLDDLMQWYPDLCLHVEELGSFDDNPLADVIIGPLLHIPERWIRRPLTTLHFHLYANTAYLHDQGPIKSHEDISRHPVFMPDAVTWPLLWQGEEKPYAAVTLSSLGDLKALALQARGLALLPRECVDTTALVPVPLLTAEPSLELYYGYPEHLKASLKVTAVYNYLLDPLEK